MERARARLLRRSGVGFNHFQVRDPGLGVCMIKTHPLTQARRQPGRARTGPARFVPPGLVLPGRGRPGPTSLRPAGPLSKELFTLLDLCVSSLRRGHANLLCIVPILPDNAGESIIYRSTFLEYEIILFKLSTGTASSDFCTHHRAKIEGMPNRDAK